MEGPKGELLQYRHPLLGFRGVLPEQPQQPPLPSRVSDMGQGHLNTSITLNRLAGILHPPHQWAPGGTNGGLQGAPQRFPNPYAMQQQPIAHPWYNPWTMQPNNLGYGAPYTMGPQKAIDQSWFKPSPSYG